MIRWLDGLEQRARDIVPEHILEYVLQGAGHSVSATEARAAWSGIRFAPHVLRDVSEVDPSVTLLGQRHDLPWGVAPTTLQRSVHPEGESAMAAACAEAGALMVVSSNAGTRFADIARTGVRWWVQAYLPRDRRLAGTMLERAVSAGAGAVVLTVDTPVVARKVTSSGRSVFAHVPDDQLRANFDPGYDALPGAAKATDLSPSDLRALRELTGLPVVVKGVLRPDDARRCVEAGAAGVWVSNHGGRQLDRTVPTAEALVGVVAAVAGAAEVYVDGGLSSGLDVLAALGLGADACFLGRLPLLALAGGTEGVRRMHRELREELVESLRLAGCATLRDTRSVVVRHPPIGR